MQQITRSVVNRALNANALNRFGLLNFFSIN